MVLSALLLAAGVWTASEMPVDVFPDLTAPTVTILTEGRGMPEEMESLVTFSLESAIDGPRTYGGSVRRPRSVSPSCRWSATDSWRALEVGRRRVSSHGRE